ncbi:hypothetical protein GC089_06525 [Cellulomonas sp. JZ18]|uniref:hypothetical protein n=1 Tax=Cellulomonas sp. JZ18 TaxID=2654191 RepID=UPI0012D37A11|nr:hypothetical protein [Cellulomonas sp. JZ18]QGQ18955.1 hypothetical protein GC089_06525 [Cellulomonas sp. JZ18]
MRGDQGLHQRGRLDVLRRGDVGEGGAVDLQRRAQLVLRHAERRGRSGEVDVAATGAAVPAAQRVGRVERGGDRVGLVLGERPVLDQPRQRLDDGLRPRGDGPVLGGGRRDRRRQHGDARHGQGTGHTGRRDPRRDPHGRVLSGR